MKNSATMNSLLLLLLAFGSPCAVASPDSDTKQKEIVMVFKTHFDIGYTHLASEAIHAYRTSMIDKALNAIDGMPKKHKGTLHFSKDLVLSPLDFLAEFTQHPPSPPATAWQASHGWRVAP